jgi:hypothetical protein
LVPFPKLCQFFVTFFLFKKILTKVTMALASMIPHTEFFVMTIVLVSMFLFVLLQVVKIGVWIGGAIWNCLAGFYFSMFRFVPFLQRCEYVLTLFLLFNTLTEVIIAHTSTNCRTHDFVVRILSVCMIPFVLFQAVKIGVWIGDAVRNCMKSIHLSTFQLVPFPKLCEYLLTFLSFFTVLTQIRTQVTMALSSIQATIELTSANLHPDFFVMAVLLVIRCLFLLIQGVKLSIWIGGDGCDHLERFFCSDEKVVNQPQCPPAPSKKPKSDGVNPMDERCFFRIEDLRRCPSAPLKKPKSDVPTLTVDALTVKPLVLFPPTTEDPQWEHLHEDQVDNHQQNDTNSDDLPASTAPLRRSLRVAAGLQKSTTVIPSTRCSTRRSARLASKARVRYCNMC